MFFPFRHCSRSRALYVKTYFSADEGDGGFVEMYMIETFKNILVNYEKTY